MTKGLVLNNRSIDTDDQVAVPVAEQTKQRFPSMDSISFDKGFHSPANQAELKEIVGQAVLPRKGKNRKFFQQITPKKQERGKGSCLFFQKTGFSVWR